MSYVINIENLLLKTLFVETKTLIRGLKMQIANMSIQNCVVIGFRRPKPDAKNQKHYATLAFMGGKIDVEMFNPADSEIWGTGKYGTAFLAMETIQNVRTFDDNNFVDTLFKAALITDFKHNK